MQVIPRHQKLLISIRDDILISTQHQCKYLAQSPLSQAATFATAAMIKVHSPHSFLGFFFDQSKHFSRGTFAFPFPYPQADTKVPKETEHKHSKVAVTQSMLVWEPRER